MSKIIIVDDHPIFLSGLKQILNDQYDLEVVGEAHDAASLYKLAENVVWDVIVLDISLPGQSGIEILEELKYRYGSKVKVFFLSNHPESQFARRALKAGAVGYMTKEAAPRELVAAIRKTASGRKYISASMAEKLADGLDIHSEVPDHEKLSHREFQVMCMIGAGKTIKEIAEILFLSVQTISTYRARILEKMEMKSSAEITRYVVENQLAL
ncbi:MAG: response regulator transcription factor [bacterium]|nr:response regulator transcription factor [bacterium]